VGPAVNVLKGLKANHPTTSKFLQSAQSLTLKPQPSLQADANAAQQFLTDITLTTATETVVIGVSLAVAESGENGITFVSDVNCVNDEIVCTYGKIKLNVTTKSITLATGGKTLTKTGLSIGGAELTIPAADAVTGVDFDTESVLTPAGGA
jgi:hypothetical protein